MSIQAAFLVVSMLRVSDDTTLAECIAATKDNDRDRGERIAQGAERHYRRMVRSNPQDLQARLALARTLSQCRTVYAGVLSQEGIVDESNDLLKDVLSRDSTNWEARYTLALNHFHVPKFFGRTDDAIKEFEHLLSQQGSRTDFPELAGTFVYLGDLYMRDGRATDATAIWKQGILLFPKDARLARRLEKYPPKSTDR